MARRGLSRLLVMVAVVLGTLAWTGFTLQRTVFDPSRSENVVRVLLDDDTVRHALLQQVVSKADAALPAEVRSQISLQQLTTAADDTLDDPRARTAIEQALVGSHRYVIGDATEAPRLDTTLIDGVVREKLAAVRPDLAALLPAPGSVVVELPAAGLSPIHRVRAAVVEFTPLLALGALCAALAALVVSPDRGGTIRRIGLVAISLGAIWIALRFALPALVELAFGDRGAIVSALARAVAGGMGVPGTVLFLAGLGLVGLSALVRSVTRGNAARATSSRGARTPGPGPDRRRHDPARPDAERATPFGPAAVTGAGAGGHRSTNGVGRAPTARPAEQFGPNIGYRPAAVRRTGPTPGGGVPMPAPHPGAPAQLPRQHGAGPHQPGSPGTAGPATGAPLPTPPTMPSPPRRPGQVDEHGAAGPGEEAGPPPTTPIPLPRRNREQPAPPAADATHAPTAGPAGSAPAPGPRPIGATPMSTGAEVTGVALPGPRMARRDPRPAPNEWLGGFSMDPHDHERVAGPPPSPPRWIEGVGYVYDYPPSASARWIDGLGYVLDDN